MKFVNNKDCIIVKYDTSLENLPRRHLIATISLKKTCYGFYLNKKDIECSKSNLFVGKSIEFPEEFQNEFILLQNIYLKLPQRINKQCFQSFDFKKSLIKRFFKVEINIFKTCCLFHKDKNPSMSVNLDSGVYYCFSCKSGGTITKLVNQIHATKQKNLDSWVLKPK